MGLEKGLEKIIQNHGFHDYKWIDPSQIVVSFWVRMKCMYGCPNYEKAAACPPNTLSVPECQNFFQEYNEAVIFRFEKFFEDPEDRHDWVKKINTRLIKLEKEVFLAGNEKAFILFMGNCSLCQECAENKRDCKHPEFSRPTPEGMAVDVFSTVRKIGFPIAVLKDYNEVMNRYAFLLIK